MDPGPTFVYIHLGSKPPYDQLKGDRKGAQLGSTPGPTQDAMLDRHHRGLKLMAMWATDPV